MSLYTREEVDQFLSQLNKGIKAGVIFGIIILILIIGISTYLISLM